MGYGDRCQVCGQASWGVKTLNGRYLCKTCRNVTGRTSGSYYCNSCGNHSASALMKGSGWIELILYLFYIVPGVIYSIWRRSGEPNVCPVCRAPALVPASAARPGAAQRILEPRDEKECPFCAEKILVKAKVCKHCKRDVEPSDSRGVITIPE